MSLVILTLVFIICSSTIPVLGNTDFAPYKTISCSQESMYYSASFLENKCHYVSNRQCFEKFANCCKGKGYNLVKAVDACAQELGRTTNDIVDQICNVTAPAYLAAMKATCCAKTKIVAQKPMNTFQKLESEIEECYDKENCDNDICK